MYGRVSLANKDMEPEVECVNHTTGKSAGFGLLKDGYVLKTSLNLCRRCDFSIQAYLADNLRLLNSSNAVLSVLGEHFGFESAIGMNGRVWIHTADERDTIIVVNAIKNSEHLASETEIRAMIKALIQTFPRS